MASSPITSWETVADFMFLGPQMTADGDCSHKIKRCLLLERNYDTLKQHIKNRDITLPMEIRLVKVFPVVMYACDIWTIKKAEC